MTDERIIGEEKQSTLIYDGVEIPDFGEMPFPYGTLELTKRCNLRCKTCFFFQAFQHKEREVPDAALIEKLRALQKRHAIRFFTWVGGEPLFRLKVLEAAVGIFPLNVVFTNGTQPIPDLPFLFGVSLDGPPEINDAIRGDGVFDKVIETISDSPRPVFFQSVVTRTNAPFLDAFLERLVQATNAFGVIFTVYIPQKGDESGMGFSLPERDRLLEKLLELKKEYGSYILNPRVSLELAFSATCKKVTDNCDMKTNSLALDYTLRRRIPCCYGDNVDCDLCGAVTPFLMASGTTLKQIFENAGAPL
ncbi:MAG: radical SAM protein [bacterium]